MPFQIIRDDITRVCSDAIVNTANPNPVYGRGTDQAIYSAAGKERLLEERRKIGTLGVGEVAVTEAFDLPAKHIIHTVGPLWQGGNQGEFDLLASCYRKSLLMARQLSCESIAFPLISSGSYHFPKDKALEIALNEIRSFLNENDMDVTLVVFDKQTYELSADLTGGVNAYIDDSLIIGSEGEEKAEEDLEEMEASLSWEASAAPSKPALFKRAKKKRRLDDLKKQVGESYQACLLRLIDERGLTDAQVYKRANIDAAAEAARFGIQASRAVRYKSDRKGTKLNYETMSSVVREVIMAESACAMRDVLDDETVLAPIREDFARRHKGE